MRSARLALVSERLQERLARDYIEASTVLHRFLEGRSEPGPEVAEAYYLLGLMESRIGRDYGASQTGFLLETRDAR